MFQSLATEVPQGGGDGELLLTNYTACARDGDKLLEMAIGDGCKTLLMYFMPLKCTLKNG